MRKNISFISQTLHVWHTCTLTPETTPIIGFYATNLMCVWVWNMFESHQQLGSKTEPSCLVFRHSVPRNGRLQLQEIHCSSPHRRGAFLTCGCTAWDCGGASAGARGGARGGAGGACGAYSCEPCDTKCAADCWSCGGWNRSAGLFGIGVRGWSGWTWIWAEGE